VVLRPPTELGQGRYAVPAWLVGVAAAALVVAVVAFFVVRHRRARRSASYDTVAPHSGPRSGPLSRR
jgi:heme/copper-type cytochrome/quinol oxidase subunit 2